MYLAVFPRWAPNAKGTTASSLHFDDSMEWNLSFRAYCHLRATTCSAMYDQALCTVALDNVYGSPCHANWYLSCRKLSLRSQQFFGEFSSDSILGGSQGTTLQLIWGFLFTNICYAASKGFQNTSWGGKMEWTKYLTEDCMTLSEHGILNKFHRLPVP